MSNRFKVTLTRMYEIVSLVVDGDRVRVGLKAKSASQVSNQMTGWVGVASDTISFTLPHWYFPDLRLGQSYFLSLENLEQ